MEKQINNFLEFIKVDKRLSNNTLQSYKRDIKQYSEYIEKTRKNFLKITENEITEYLTYLNSIGRKASTISRNLASIRSFYQYMVRVKKIKKDPTENIQAPKVEKKAPCVLTSSEVELLLSQPSTIDLKGIRDKAMLEFAYATGMRVTEIISLDVQDINLEEGSAVCRSGAKSRKIPLGKMCIKALKE